MTKRDLGVVGIDLVKPLRVVVAGLVLVLAATALPAAAAAPGGSDRAPASARAGDDGIRAWPGAGRAGRTAEAADWTPARMAAALPVEQLYGDVLARSSAEPATGPVTPARSAQRPRRVKVPRTAGKLFFSTSQGDAVCSASAIRTRGRDQVVTAGHCVHSGPASQAFPTPEWFSDWVFVPRYHNGRRPDGRWVAKNAWIFAGWAERGAFSRDQAIVEFKRRKGRTLVGTVGGNRVRTGLKPVQRNVRVWGWPAQGRYNGETAHHCDGRTTRRGRSNDAKIVCAMTGGSSGGPWLLPARRGASYVWAVTSRRSLGIRPAYLYAVPLGRKFQQMVRRSN